MIEHYNGDDYSYSNRSNIVSSLWAFAVIMGMVILLMVVGLCATVYFIGDDAAVIYLVAVGVMIVLAFLFGGIYAMMRLLVGHALGLQRSNADLLHAHSMSGAQQARAVTEVIRGANQINKADADTQMEMMRSWQRIGSVYETQLAKMRAQLIDQQAPAENDDSPYFLPAAQEGEVINYKLPKVS